jgi:hypothetical protein
MGGIVQTDKNFNSNTMKSQPSLLTVNHYDSDVGHLKHCMQIYQSARLLFHLAFLQLEEFREVQLNYSSLQARNQVY